MRYSFGAMRRALTAFLLAAAALTAAAQEKSEKKAAWPLSLADGFPKEIPGYAAAPRDPLPDTDENAMGVFTQVARFYQRIESPTVTRQFQLVVQDYGKDKNLEAEIRKAVAEAGKVQGIEARDVMVGGLKALAVTDRTGPTPTTLITVIVLPSRLLLAQCGNLDRDAALKLVSYVDFPRIAAAR
jgi:hypothetical protein